MNVRLRLAGAVLVGAEERFSRTTFLALDPATGEVLKPEFPEADLRDVNDAIALSAPAFGQSSGPPPAARAGFLERVATAISALGNALIDRAIELTLPPERE
jgi:NADP-dependent aldehyde dehydrogenase